MVFGNQVYIRADPVAAGTRQPADPARGLSEPRILLGSSDAVADLRQASCDLVCRAVPEAHRASARLRRCCSRPLRSNGVRPELRDERCTGTPLGARFLGTLTEEQEAAARALSAHDIGVLAATTAFGKTVVASWLIAERNHALVLVHRRQLLEQWVDDCRAFSDFTPSSSVGSGADAGRRPGCWMWRSSRAW